MGRRADAVDEVAVEVPQQFLFQVLPGLTNIPEIQVCFAYFRLSSNRPGPVIPVQQHQFLSDAPLLAAMRISGSLRDPAELIMSGLERAVSRETLTATTITSNGHQQALYVYSGPGARHVDIDRHVASVAFHVPTPSVAISAGDNVVSIYKLYEQHVAPMTPLIADRILAASERHSEERVQAAIMESVKRNRHSWRFIETLLLTWQHADETGSTSEDHRHETSFGDAQREIDMDEYGDGRHLRRARKVSLPDLP